MSQNLLLNKLKKYFINFIFAVSILFFFIAANFQDNNFGGWELQYLPVSNVINDVTFLDSLTGFVATGVSSNISYILKTTNGGYNWVSKKTNTHPFTKIVFLNKNVGYCASWDTLFKTTNAGENWTNISIGSFGIWISDMHILNEDTIWVVMSEGLVGGIFRTTNGGQNWVQQFSQFQNNPDKIYMANKNLGFMRKGNPPFSSYVGRTTNGGFNWVLTTEDTAFVDIHFTDSLNGWMAQGTVKKTTNGGLNWSYQYIPKLNFVNGMEHFSFVNKDTIWGVNGQINTPGGRRGIIYKTTNGGVNWGYQIPDTGFRIPAYSFIKFTDNFKGWAFSDDIRILHTTTGGDSTLYVGINQYNENIPTDFRLGQNYPNPFNATTIINYQLTISNNIKLIIFDITGKKIELLLNKQQERGNYDIKFDGSNLSSGIYFYTVFINDIRVDTKKMLLIK